MPVSDNTTIAILGSFPPLRGISSYCLEMATAMAAHARVAFISFKHIYPGFLYPGGRPADDDSFPAIDQPNLRVRRRLTWYNPLSWLREGLLTPANLLHAQWWSMPLAPIYGAVAGLFKLRRKPVVFTVHNAVSHEKSPLFTLVSKWLFKLGDHFIVHTKRNARQMQCLYGVPAAKISIIPHGSLDFQVNADTDRQAVRRELGFHSNDKVVLVFGAIRPYKGVATAIRAIAAVREIVPEAKLLIAGKLWEDWAPYQQLITRLGMEDAVASHLHYIPAAEVHRFFAAADLALLPYRHFDSQSGVGSSAMAFGTPLIVSDVGGLPDLVPDRRCVVTPGDPKALAAAVTAILTTPSLLAEITAGMAGLREHFSWARIAAQTMDVYRDVRPHPSHLRLGQGRA